MFCVTVILVVLLYKTIFEAFLPGIFVSKESFHVSTIDELIAHAVELSIILMEGARYTKLFPHVPLGTRFVNTSKQVVTEMNSNQLKPAVFLHTEKRAMHMERSFPNITRSPRSIPEYL